jgi:hypothetical protein
MGYRSDGAIAISGPHELVTTEIARLMLTGDETLRKVLTDEFKLVPYSKDRVVLGLEYDGWKMYPDYADVRALMAVFDHFATLHAADPEKSLLAGAWVRIGEEDDDVETKYFGDNGYGLASVSRRVCCDADFDADDIRHSRTSTLE